MDMENIPTRRNTVKHWVLFSLDAVEHANFDPETGENPARESGVTPREMYEYAGGDSGRIFKSRNEVSAALSELARDSYGDRLVNRRTDATGWRTSDVEYRYRLTGSGREAIEYLGVPARLPNRKEYDTDDERELHSEPNHVPGWWHDAAEREYDGPDTEPESSEDEGLGSMLYGRLPSRESDAIEVTLSVDRAAIESFVEQTRTANLHPPGVDRYLAGEMDDDEFAPLDEPEHVGTPGVKVPEPEQERLFGEDDESPSRNRGPNVEYAERDLGDWKLRDGAEPTALPSAPLKREVLDRVAAAGDDGITANRVVEAFDRGNSPRAYLSALWQDGLVVRRKTDADTANRWQFEYRLSGDAIMLYRALHNDGEA